MTKHPSAPTPPPSYPPRRVPGTSSSSKAETPGTGPGVAPTPAGISAEEWRRGIAAGSGPFIMALLLAALGMGLAALIVFHLIMRARAPEWPPPGSPPLPRALWLSTGLIVLSSLTVQGAVWAAQQGRTRSVRHLALATLLLAIGFIVSQIVNWGLAVAAHLPPGLNMYAVTFYLLTGLHGLHVLGGLVPLTICTLRAFHGCYTPGRHAGLTYAAVYWHFVGFFWLVMFAVMWVG